LDRQIVIPGQIPLDTDLLNTNKNVMLALGEAFEAIFGTNTLSYGLGVTATTPASLTVNIAPGSIYALSTVDANAYGSLPADTSDTIVKQGVLLSGTTETLTTPTTAGYSQVVLIEAAFNEVDSVPVLLPFYDAANPSQPLQGPGGNNQQTNTRRQGQVSIIPKYGVAAPTGSQIAPSPDAGYIGLATITLTYGQTQITSANISAVSGSTLNLSLLSSIQANTLCSGTDVGAVNACVVNLNPSPSSLVNNMMVEFQVAVTNTTNATLNLNGSGAFPIIGVAHLALQGDELVAGGKAQVIWSTPLSSWILLSCTGGAQQVGAASQSHHAMQLGQATGRLLNVQVFAASGTYTNTPGTTSIIVDGVGAGAGGGGCPSTTSSQQATAGGGQGGGYAKARFTTGFSGGISVTIGAAGSGGATGSNAGTSGGTTSFGTLLSIPGGAPGGAGSASAATAGVFPSSRGSVPTVSGGTLLAAQAPCSGPGALVISLTQVLSGAGGNTPFGVGGSQVIGAPGLAGSGYGSGGSGCSQIPSEGGSAGGNGAQGILYVYEYA
jgi:hypothetical protein